MRWVHSDFIQDHQNPPGDGFGGSGVGLDLNELNGEGAIVRPQNQAALLIIEIAEREVSTSAHGVERRTVRTVGRERVVVAVDDCIRIRKDDRLHGQGFDRRDAHGDESLPHATRTASVNPRGLQSRCGQMKQGMDGAGPYVRIVRRSRVGDDRDGTDICFDGH